MTVMWALGIYQVYSTPALYGFFNPDVHLHYYVFASIIAASSRIILPRRFRWCYLHGCCLCAVQLMIFRLYSCTLENQEETWNSGLVPLFLHCPSTWITPVVTVLIRLHLGWEVSIFISPQVSLLYATCVYICPTPHLPKWVIWEWGASYNRYYSHMLVCCCLNLQCTNPLTKHPITHRGFHHTEFSDTPVACYL